MTQTRSKRIIVGIALLIGAVSGFFVYLGFQALGSNDFISSFMYIGAGIGGFVAVGYRLLKIRNAGKGNVESAKEVYTTLECTQCDKKIERPFVRGDYIYQNIGPCVDCSGQLLITKIITTGETH